MALPAVAAAIDPLPHLFQSGAQIVAADVNANFLLLHAALARQEALAVPVGSILPFAGEAIPSGWLLCDGNAVSVDDYPDLHAVLGTQWGDGRFLANGELSGHAIGEAFNLPDLRGQFLRGHDAGFGRDPDAHTRSRSNQGGAEGDEVGTVQSSATALPKTKFSTASGGGHAHQHGKYDNQTGTGSHGYALHGGQWQNVKGSGEHTHEITLGGDAESRPTNVAVQFIVHAG